jgi:hypothetical protein
VTTASIDLETQRCGRHPRAVGRNCNNKIHLSHVNKANNDVLACRKAIRGYEGPTISSGTRASPELGAFSISAAREQSTTITSTCALNDGSLKKPSRQANPDPRFATTLKAERRHHPPSVLQAEQIRTARLHSSWRTPKVDRHDARSSSGKLPVPIPFLGISS